MSGKNLSLSEFQKRVNSWIEKHGGYWPPLSMLAAIIEEIGEVSRELNHIEGYKPKKQKPELNSNLGEELGDLLFTLICLANSYNVDLGTELTNVLQKYTNRDSKRFMNLDSD